MKDQEKTKEQLIIELEDLRRRNAELGKANAEIFEQAPIASELFDADGQLIDANSACLNLFGVDSIEKVKGFKILTFPGMQRKGF